MATPKELPLKVCQSLNLGKIKGILFDVDGTLYHQTPLRVIMIFLLLLSNIRNPKQLLRKVRVISAYRKAQEALRNSALNMTDYPRRQIELAWRNTGESAEYISETVTEWFQNRPLPYLRFCRRRGTRTFIQLLRQSGFKLGVYSDYPVEDKLHALGVSKDISVVVSSNDPEVKGFKPRTNGFHVAAKRMGLHPSDILYIGDRPEVDGAGGSAAGMQVIILGSDHKTNCNSPYPSARTYHDLLKIFNK